MQYYELLYIIPANENVEAVRARVTGLISAQNSEILRNDEVARMRLAYPIERVRQGVYVFVVFQAASASVKALEATLRVERLVPRFTLVKTTEAAVTRPVQLTPYQAPLVEREESGRRGPAHSAPAPRTIPRPKVTPSLSSEELEKQIDKIIEEKVL